MSPDEVGWRMHSALRDVLDRYRFRRLRRTAVQRSVLSGDWRPAFAVTDIPVGAWSVPQGNSSSESAGQNWVRPLLRQADEIAEGRLSFFDLESCDLGRPIGWNHDHSRNRSIPLRFAAAVDYRDYDAVGDAKLAWEPNRHHQFVVLGRAYRATGDERYAVAVCAQLTSWLEQCPFGLGMHWRSPLELAVRLINWVWALDLIRPSGCLDATLRARLLRSVSLHLWEITRKYSRGSSANNHRIGEAAGVFIAARYFQGLKDAERWTAEAREILCTEILAQTYPDGGSREQALGYQSFVLQFLLLSGLVGRQTRQDFPPAYWERLTRMFEFVAALLEGGDAPPMFGDCDDGYVLDLGQSEGAWRAWLSVAAVLCGRGDFRALAGAYSECATWLLGPAGRAQYDVLCVPAAEQPLASRAFPESGYYLLQHGRAGDAARISVLFDCGELGFGPLAAHGHADALSVALRAFDRDVLVDPGTYDYFTYPLWRDYFRSTRAHNTVEIDGVDQSVAEGPFMWGARARATCLSWRPSAAGGHVAGQHDGYTRLTSPVVHRRRLELDGPARTLTIQDELRARGPHEVAVYFHLAESWRVSRSEPQRVVLDSSVGQVEIALDPRLTLELRQGSERPPGGWVSRGYHRKVPAVTLVGRCAIEGDTSLICRVAMGRPR